jgi:hypothetical protein
MQKRGLSKDSTERLLQKVKGLNIEEYYGIKFGEELTPKNKGEIRDLTLKPRDVRYNEELGHFEYKAVDLSSDGSIEWKKITIDYSTNFTESNKWVSQRLPDSNEYFLRGSATDLTDEQEAFYICAVVAGTYSNDVGEFFRDNLENYDLENWRPSESGETWSEVLEEITEIGSFNIKMLVSACRYKIQTEKNDVFSYTNAGLPEAEVLKLDKLKNNIKRKRMEYDEGELSQESRSRKSKLEIKILNQQLDDEIKKIKMSDPDLHELWCVFKINSENVEPNIKFKFKRIARLNFKEDLEAGDIISREELQKPNFREVYLDYAYKELLRAYISKLRQDELKKYKQAIADGTSYYAPKRK